jgi:hypothetical protein
MPLGRRGRHKCETITSIPQKTNMSANKCEAFISTTEKTNMYANKCAEQLLHRSRQPS